MIKKSLTPISDFLEYYAGSGTARFHMPGHKGNFTFKSRGGGIPFTYDITEISGADSLYSANGIIKESEAAARGIFNTGATVFSAGGSTLCIQAMLLCALRPGDAVICGRNAHAAFHNAAALFDLIPYWIYPECRDGAGISGTVSPAQVKAAADALFAAGKKPGAVYITSPDYTGLMCDIKGIAAVCSERDIPLLVDNAHGAHLKFTPKDRHPISLGADICCDSAHKTLPALTGAAYLHAGKRYNERELKDAMSLVGSTSPSYLILNSLDICNEYLSLYAENDFKKLEEYNAGLKDTAERAGFGVLRETDCTKLTLNACKAGFDAPGAADYFRENNIECEYAGGGDIVFLMTPFNSDDDFKRLNEALRAFPARKEIPFTPYSYQAGVSFMTPHKAFISEKEILPAELSVGRCAAQAAVACPPGVPVVSYGEIITEKAAALLKNSGNSTVKVVK